MRKNYPTDMQHPIQYTPPDTRKNLTVRFAIAQINKTCLVRFNIKQYLMICPTKYIYKCPVLSTISLNAYIPSLN